MKVDNKLNNFKMLPDEILKIKEISLKNSIPIIEDEILNFLLFYLPNLKVENIVEIGTGYGFSASVFRYIFDDASITTVERKVENYKMATDLVKELNIKIKNMDALEFIDNYNEKIDLLFIDGGKSHYKELLLKSLKNLDENSVIISDNIFARGITFGENIDRRNRTIKRRMNEFIDEILSEKYYTYILPIGDGLAITKLRKDGD